MAGAPGSPCHLDSTRARTAALPIVACLHPRRPDWPEEALPDMFPDYWAGRSPLLGEPGSRGWAAWLAGWQAAPTLAPAAAPLREPATVAEPGKVEGGGAAGGTWTGWEELGPAIRRRFGHGLDVGPPPAGGDEAGGRESDGDHTESGREREDSDEEEDRAQMMEEEGEAETEEEESEEALMAR